MTDFDFDKIAEEFFATTRPAEVGVEVKALAALLRREVETAIVSTLQDPKTNLARVIESVTDEFRRTTIELSRVPAILHCPSCKAQHVDKDLCAGCGPHLCAGCGLEWRASTACTVGVEKLP